MNNLFTYIIRLIKNEFAVSSDLVISNQIFAFFFYDRKHKTNSYILLYLTCYSWSNWKGTIWKISQRESNRETTAVYFWNKVKEKVFIYLLLYSEFQRSITIAQGTLQTMIEIVLLQ